MRNLIDKFRASFSWPKMIVLGLSVAIFLGTVGFIVSQVIKL